MLQILQIFEFSLKLQFRFWARKFKLIKTLKCYFQKNYHLTLKAQSNFLHEMAGEILFFLRYFLHRFFFQGINSSCFLNTKLPHLKVLLVKSCLNKTDYHQSYLMMCMILIIKIINLFDI